MIGRVVRSEEFERALGRPPRLRSAHFSLHHADDVAKVPAHEGANAELSTDAKAVGLLPVDDLKFPARATGSAARLGLVVPKRHARRSVTRSLLKRLMRSAVDHHASRLSPGIWVLRLRSPYGRDDFPSAASNALQLAVRAELDGLLGRLKSPAT